MQRLHTVWHEMLAENLICWIGGYTEAAPNFTSGTTQRYDRSVYNGAVFVNL